MFNLVPYGIFASMLCFFFLSLLFYIYCKSGMDKSIGCKGQRYKNALIVYAFLTRAISKGLTLRKYVLILIFVCVCLVSRFAFELIL